VSLREYPELIQGTDEWHEQRRGMVTASVVGQLMTPATLKPAANVESRSLVAQLVAERITGWVDPTYVGDDMMRGWTDEPHALETYAKHYAPIVTTGLMVRDDWGFEIGYSPDGLVGEEGLVEFKSRRPKKHVQTILAGKVPGENMAQVQCGLLVSGRKWCDYLSFCGGMPLYRIRVEADERWQAAIVAAVAAFEEAAAEMTTQYLQAVAGLPMTERIVEMEMVL
jgi:hypothetical protein